MTTESAYDVSTMPGGVDYEMKRLRDQALLTWDREARNMKWWGLRDGMSIIDVGSGPGFVSEALLDMLASSHVTGLELDPVMVERAEKYLGGRGDGRWTSIQGSVMATGLPDKSFDWAIARYLFQHIPDRVGAAQEILRILKPGGKLVVCDVDDALHLWDPPDPPEMKAVNERYTEEHKAKGGDRHVGRKLLRILQQAGFHNCTLEAVILHSDEVGVDKLLPPSDPEIYKSEVEAGKISPRELEIILETEEKLRGPDGITMLTILMVCGEKQV